jgi:ferredoxin
MDLEIKIDRRRCMGSGQCVHWAPGVFAQDDHALSVVVDRRGEPEERIVTAVTRCPVEAITLEVDGVPIGPGQLQDWYRGSLAEVPLVGLLARLGEEHEALRSSLAACRRPAATRASAGKPGRAAAGRHGGPGSEEAADRLADLVHLLSVHHALEEGSAYPKIEALVGPGLVDPFDRDHDRMAESLRALDRGSAPAGTVGGAAALAGLAAALDEHIRLEEAVLFPAALSALADAGGAVRGA